MGRDILGNKKIAIIGLGHMGSAIMVGLLNTGVIPKSHIVTSNSSSKNKIVVSMADIIIIAVKPNQVKQVVSELKDELKGKLVLSVVAKVTIKDLKRYAENSAMKFIRLMPNIPLIYNEGVIGLYADDSVLVKDKNNIIRLFSLLGKVITVEKESDIDILTLVSSCSPAIIAYFIEIMAKYASSLGLNDKEYKAVLQAFKGTVTYLEKSKINAVELQKMVATKGGITEIILSSLKETDFQKLFIYSMNKGYSKIK